MKRLILSSIWGIVIGIIVFLLAVLVERSFSVNTFCKGLGIGIMIGGVIGVIGNLIKEKQDNKLKCTIFKK